MPEGDVLLLQLSSDVGRPMRLIGVGVLQFDRQAGRDQLVVGALSPLLDLDYDVDLRVCRPRVPHVDFASATGREDVESAAAAGGRLGEGDLLVLHPSHSLVERSAVAVDFAGAPEREVATATCGVVDGTLLELEPQPDAILPRHGTLVTMHQPSGRAGRRRVRRRECVRTDDAILCEIERELAAVRPEVLPGDSEHL